MFRQGLDHIHGLTGRAVDALDDLLNAKIPRNFYPHGVGSSDASVPFFSLGCPDFMRKHVTEWHLYAFPGHWRHFC